MLGPGGRGMGVAWARGASGGMSASQSASQTSNEGGSSGAGGGSRGGSNRYHLLDDDSGTHGSDSQSKAPFSGRSSLGGPPSSGRSHQDYRPMSGATKSALYQPKSQDQGRETRYGMDSSRSQNTGASSFSPHSPVLSTLARVMINFETRTSVVAFQAQQG